MYVGKSEFIWWSDTSMKQAAHQNNWANWDKSKTSHPKSEVASQFIKRHHTYPYTYILLFSSVFLSLGHMCRAQKLFKSRAIQSAIACREVLDGSSAVFAWEEMESSTAVQLHQRFYPLGNWIKVRSALIVLRLMPIRLCTEHKKTHEQNVSK